MGDTRGRETVAVMGDLHGHLQLALCALARWQRELNEPFDLVLLCGDVGTFAAYEQLDSATIKHAKRSECEYEFLRQWSVRPQPPWLDRIFDSVDAGGLGLTCPVVMVHGNHEGFAHLADLASTRPPGKPVPLLDLSGVDPHEHVRYLPSGWTTVTPRGRVIGGVGGNEAGQRKARYHPMAYIDPDRVTSLLARSLDVLVTHQGPAAVQGDQGSPTLDHFLEIDHPPGLWFHGHSVPQPDVVNVAGGRCTIVPLDDVAFSGRGHTADDPGLKGWCRVTFDGGGDARIDREPPPFWRDYRRSKWRSTRDGLLICPDLVTFVPRDDLRA